MMCFVGLDAVVFCNCVEKKRLRVPHPYPQLLYIDANGSPEIDSDDSAKMEEHYEWMELPPCKHSGMQFCGATLGNAGGIHFLKARFQAVLKAKRLKCPVLMRRVLYSGTHTGDHLTVAQVAKLAAELKGLQKIDFKELGVLTEDLRYIKQMLKELEQVVQAAEKLGKPIAF
jgi:hypothetical protein